MTERVNERELIRVVAIRQPDGTYRSAFAFDGRRYDDEQALRAEIEESIRVLADRRIAGQHHVHPATPTEPAPNLPTWAEYKRSLPADGGDAGSA